MVESLDPQRDDKRTNEVKEPKSTTNSKAGAVTVLRNSTWFAGLSDEVIKEIADLSVLRIYDPGEVVFRRGEAGDHLFGILSGELRVTTQSRDGRELALNRQGPGEISGEIAFLDGGTRTASGAAVSTTTVFAIPREQFNELMLERPTIALHLIKLLCERVRWTSARVEQAAFLSVPERLALQLESLHSALPSGEDAVKISQAELALFLNVSRQVVNGYLQDWQRQGWVTLGRGNIVVHDLSEVATGAI